MTYYLACIAHPFIRGVGIILFAIAYPVLKADDGCQIVKERGRKR